MKLRPLLIKIGFLEVRMLTFKLALKLFYFLVYLDIELILFFSELLYLSL